MFTEFYEKLESSSPVAVVVISVALMLFIGFAMTRLTKLLRLPNVTAYIVAGVLIGPYFLDLVPVRIIEGMDFIADIATAFIAFAAGEFFRFSSLKKNGAKVILIALAEALTASLLVFTVTYFILRLEFVFSVVLAALASVTAPSSTVMTIRQTGAKGDFVDTLLQVIALDDILGLMAYSVTVSVALSTLSAPGTPVDIGSLLIPMFINIGIMILGGAFGFFMKLLMPTKRSNDNKLIISTALLFAFCGICALLDVSPLLGCMSMSMVYINITDDDKLFKQLNYFSPPLLLIFFVRSGMCFDLGALLDPSSSLGSVTFITVALVYFFIRIIGKYLGAFLGSAIVKKPKSVRNFLGLALVPQAGVAIGLAALGARTIGGEVGNALNTIILASSILYEIVGPVCAKLSLYLSGSYSDKIEELASVEEYDTEGNKMNSVDILIARLDLIRKELPKREEAAAEDEKAFEDAADDQMYYSPPSRMRRFINRR